jgi:hypothetical protein
MGGMASKYWTADEGLRRAPRARGEKFMVKINGLARIGAVRERQEIR